MTGLPILHVAPSLHRPSTLDCSTTLRTDDRLLGLFSSTGRYDVHHKHHSMFHTNARKVQKTHERKSSSFIALSQCSLPIPMPNPNCPQQRLSNQEIGDRVPIGPSFPSFHLLSASWISLTPGLTSRGVLMALTGESVGLAKGSLTLRLPSRVVVEIASRDMAAT